MDICGKPLLLWQVERLRRCRLVDQVVIATTTNPADDLIEKFCDNFGIRCYRGSEIDVLKRIATMVSDLTVDIHVECFGDSPLVDPQIVDEFIGYYLKNRKNYDYVSSAIKSTYPPGMEVTVCSGEALLKTNLIVSDKDPLREHAGYNTTRFPEQFRLKCLEAPKWFHYPDMYLEVDTQEDLEVIKSVIEHFTERGQIHFTLSQIIDFMSVNQFIANRNIGVERRWKALRKESNV